MGTLTKCFSQSNIYRKNMDNNTKYDSDEFSERPSCLDAAYEREAILSGLVGRRSAVFSENREPASTSQALQHREVRGDRRDRGLETRVQPR